MHETKRAEELVCSKLEFEDLASRHNVKKKHIRADNGIYATKLFKETCAKNMQTLTFCAVCAH